MKKSAIICILDGWGHREEKKYNAVVQNDEPMWDPTNERLKA